MEVVLHNGMSAEAAQERLQDIFERTDAARSDFDGPYIGIVGNGAPETLIAASGATPVHLNFPHADSSADGAIDAVIERFVDEEVRVFLRRFAGGAFDDLAGIMFVRDDAAALTAYQYAIEWVRQGNVPAGTPPLFLFNLVHSSTDAATAFNAIQADKLAGFLTSVGLAEPDAEALARHARVAVRRQEALACLEKGRAAMVWRNAGRFIPAEHHADLIERACGGGEAREPARLRLGLVGSPLASAAAYDTFARHGDVVADLQSFGEVWPGRWETVGEIGDLLRTLAADPYCPRISPPHLHRKALVEALVGAECDLVLCQLAQTDDTFGWEIPSLSKALAEHGIGLVNLGFRDPEPDRAWHDRANKLITKALETKS